MASLQANNLATLIHQHDPAVATAFTMYTALLAQATNLLQIATTNLPLIQLLQDFPSTTGNVRVECDESTTLHDILRFTLQALKEYASRELGPSAYPELHAARA
jgi:hypothetical protein